MPRTPLPSTSWPINWCEPIAYRGDVIVCSGLIAYLGAFTPDFRERTVKTWTELSLEKAIPGKEKVSLEVRGSQNIDQKQRKRQKTCPNRPQATKSGSFRRFLPWFGLFHLVPLGFRMVLDGFGPVSVDADPFRGLLGRAGEDPELDDLRPAQRRLLYRAARQLSSGFGHQTRLEMA